MRILHTSDWHLGALFCERSRADAQRHFLDWLRATLEARQVDALVVAGDVFDTPNPPAEALALYYGFLADLARAGGATSRGGRRAAIILGGNHDSAARLDAPREALRALDAHVVGGYDADRAGRPDGGPAGVLVPLRDGAGQVRLVVAAVPYLNDWRIGVRGFDVTPAEQLASMHEAFAAVYAGLADQAAAAYPGAPLMATGHLTCLAERGRRVTAEDAAPLEINRVGTLGAMAPSIFDPRYRYVALGHLHRGFPVEPGGRVRYAGTPVQVSAVEPADERAVLLVAFGEDGDDDAVRVERLAVPVRRRLVALRGAPEEVRGRVAALEVPAGELPPLVAVDLVLAEPDVGAEAALRDAVERAHPAKVELVHVRATVARRGGAVDAAEEDAVRADLTPETVLRYAWRKAHGAEAEPPEEVLQRFRALLGAPAARGEAGA